MVGVWQAVRLGQVLQVVAMAIMLIVALVEQEQPIQAAAVVAQVFFMAAAVLAGTAL